MKLQIINLSRPIRFGSLEVGDNESIESISVSAAIDEAARTFTAKGTVPIGKRIPFQENDEIVVLLAADGDPSIEQPVFTGFAEVIEINGSVGGIEYSISGRDSNSDLVDSDLYRFNIEDILKEVESGKRTSFPLSDLISRVLLNINSSKTSEFARENAIFLVTSLTSRDPAVPVLTTGNETDILSIPAGKLEFNPSDGTNAFKFIEDISAQLGILIQSDSGGVISLTKASNLPITPDRGIPTLRNRLRSDNNNVISFSFTLDSSELFSRYYLSGQSTPFIPNNPSSIQDPGLNLTLGQRQRIGKQLVIENKENQNQNSTQRLQFEVQLREARKRTYNAKVADYISPNGGIWRPGDAVRVVDDHVFLDDTLTIQKVVYDWSIGSGAETLLSMVNGRVFQDLSIIQAPGEKTDSVVEKVKKDQRTQKEREDALIREKQSLLQLFP